jgi:hypothetical protein
MDTTEPLQPITYIFTDDGLVPNNPLPFVCYRGVIPLDRVDPESTVEALFASNNWGDIWRNGVFDYLHYHSMIRWAWRAVALACASAATTARSWKSRPAMRQSFRLGPVINVSGPAAISAWWVPIRAPANTTWFGPARRRMPARFRQFRRCRD